MKSGKINGKTMKGGRLIFTIVGIALLVSLITPAIVLADDPDSEYYRVRAVTLVDGTGIDEIVINGPPTPPPGYDRVTADLPEPDHEAGLNVLSDVPAFDWSFGCSATSAAMIAGYYDRTGYANMYAGQTNGGVMPMNNSVWPDWYDGSAWRHQCPLSATHNGLDGRTTNGHVDDYWISYGSTGPDPWVGNPPEHTLGGCTGDFMRTNQWVWVSPPNSFNTDGGTTFYYYTSGAPTPASVLEGAGPPYSYDGGAVGSKLFYESRGYTVDTMYNQYIKGQGSNPALGFTYDQYKAEIDAGRPVMIHLEGHTIVGVGYDDSSSDLMYIHDTWDYSTYTMTWGGTYHGMEHRGVTVIQLQSLPVITSCDASGNEMNQFTPNQSVYAKGSGLEANTSYKIWIQDNAVEEGDALVTAENPSSATTPKDVTTNSSGNLAPTLIWHIPPAAPITHHNYDIVFDDQEAGTVGTYNSTSDGLDSTTVAGFVAPIPELPTIILFSIGLLMLVGCVMMRRQKSA